MHLLFQKPPAAGILAGDDILGVLHALLDAAVFFHLLVVLLPFLPGLAGLVFDGVAPPLGVGAVVQPVGGTPGRLALPGVLDVEDHGGGVLNERFVVGDIEDDPRVIPKPRLQPLQGFQVHVAGGFVQQQGSRTAEQQPPQLQLDLLPAGEAGYRAVRVELLRRQAQLPGDIRQLFGRQVEEIGRRGAEVVDAPGFLLLAEVLGQVAHGPRVPGDLSAPLAVVLHHPGVVNPLEEGGFSVALLADDHGLVPIVEDKGKILRQGPQVLAVRQGQMFYLQHKGISSNPLSDNKKGAFGQAESAEGRYQGAPKQDAPAQRQFAANDPASSDFRQQEPDPA